jgi:hypothetical protein
MARRGAIGRMNGSMNFLGVRHTKQSDPAQLGKTLWHLYHHVFNKDLNRMLTVLIDEHPGGWSTINGADFNLPPNYKDASGAGPKCYCHGISSSMVGIITREDFNELEWVYAFNTETSELQIFGNNGLILRVNLDQGKEPAWDTMLCGPNFERCGHTVVYHKPEFENTPTGRMAMITYMGHRPPDVYDVGAVYVNNVRYNLTGHTRGGNGVLHAMGIPVGAEMEQGEPVLRRMVLAQGAAGGAAHHRPPDAAAEAVDLIIGREAPRVPGNYTPSEGVVWLVPPLHNQTEETRYVVPRVTLRI